MFHTQQALALWISFIVFFIIIAVLDFLSYLISDTLDNIRMTVTGAILWVVVLVYLVFWIIGLINAIRGKAKRLPFIGSLGFKFTFIK